MRFLFLRFVSPVFTARGTEARKRERERETLLRLLGRFTFEYNIYIYIYTYIWCTRYLSFPFTRYVSPTTQNTLARKRALCTLRDQKREGMHIKERERDRERKFESERERKIKKSLVSRRWQGKMLRFYFVKY